jgi:hypothetical protein
MPKRIVDGEALWGSSKIAQLPVWAKAEYANLLPLAGANGTFECDARQIWARVYSFNRPEMTPDQVAQILSAFEKVGLLGRWKEKNGRICGYFIGIHKPGRLPPKSRSDSKHWACGPSLPQHLANRWVSNGSLGLGLGLGLGSGIGETPVAVATDDSVKPIPDWIPTDAWSAYLKLRKAKRAKVTVEAIDLLVRKLDAWRSEGQDVREILEKSVMNGWMGIFPLEVKSKVINGDAHVGENHNLPTDSRTQKEMDDYAAELKVKYPDLAEKTK